MAASSTFPIAKPRWYTWLEFTPWISGGLLYGLLVGMVYFRLAHPHFLPVVSFLALLLISTCLTVSIGLWRLIRGPGRLRGLPLLTISTMPLALLALHGSVANAKNNTEHRFDGFGQRLLHPLATSLMDLEARFRFPDRTVGRKVVMIHAGIADAAEQVEAMDRHVERIERLLGRQAVGQIHWVRGAFFGRSGLSFWGVALGSDGAKRIPSSDGLTTLDRHEVAHGAIDDLSASLMTGPPSILVEGWAESQSGYLPTQLYGNAASQRETWVPLKDLILPGHPMFEGRIYQQGGVLVDYLLTQFGGPAFEAFYHDCSPQTFDSDCRRHFGMGLEELDAAYSHHLDELIATGTYLQRSLEATRCGPDVDPAKWQTFVRTYIATLYPPGAPKADPEGGDFSFTSVYKNKSFEPPMGESSSECSYALSGQLGFRLDQSTEGWQTLFLANPSGAFHLIRQTPTNSWVAQPSRFGGELAYRDRLQFIRQGAVGLLEPSFLKNDFWHRVGAEGATVTKMEELEEAGKQRLRITMECSFGGEWLLRSETTLAGIDQAYAPIRLDVHNFQPGERTVHVRSEYEQVGTRTILKKMTGEATGPNGQVLREFSNQIKDFKLGAKPPESFTLEALGVTESDIVEQPASDSPAGTQASWQAKLPLYLVGWLLFCLLTGIILAGRSTASARAR